MPASVAGLQCKESYNTISGTQYHQGCPSQKNTIHVLKLLPRPAVSHLLIWCAWQTQVYTPAFQLRAGQPTPLLPNHTSCDKITGFAEKASSFLIKCLGWGLSPTLCSWPIRFLQGLISTYLTPCPGGLSPLLLLLLALSFFLFPAPARGDVINFLVLNLYTLNPFRQHSKRGDGSCCACLLCSLLEAVQGKKNTQNKSYWTGTFS